MGFSLNKISPIIFDVENPQIPADCGIKSRALTSTPRERRAPQTHNEAADLNEAHHEPRGNTSYNPDKSITNKHVQGRFIPPKVGNMPTQQQQQQSSSEEGSKENTILNGPRNERGKDVLKAILQGQQIKCHKDSPYSTHITNQRTTTGSPSQQSKQRPPGSTRMQWHHQHIHQSTCKWQRPRSC